MLDNPGRAYQRDGAIFLMARPPLLDQGGECARIKHSGNSFTRSDAVGYIITLASRANSAA